MKGGEEAGGKRVRRKQEGERDEGEEGRVE